MPSAESVRPEKFRNIKVLFDDGSYSVISGLYDGGKHTVLGERWNGERGGLGFPNVAGNPVWHVVPDFLAVAVLEALLDEISAKRTASSERQLQSVLDEIKAQLIYRGKA
jgi:hypothetical protein